MERLLAEREQAKVVLFLAAASPLCSALADSAGAKASSCWWRLRAG